MTSRYSLADTLHVFIQANSGGFDVLLLNRQAALADPEYTSCVLADLGLQEGAKMLKAQADVLDMPLDERVVRFEETVTVAAQILPVEQWYEAFKDFEEWDAAIAALHASMPIRFTPTGE